MALRAGVVRRRRHLVLRAALRRACMRLLLLGNGHRAREASRGCRSPSRRGSIKPELGQLRPAWIGLTLMPVVRRRDVQIDPAHRAQACALGSAEHLRRERQRSASRAHEDNSRTPPSTYGDRSSSLSPGWETSRESTAIAGTAGSRHRMHGPESVASNRSRSAYPRRSCARRRLARVWAPSTPGSARRRARTDRPRPQGPAADPRRRSDGGRRDRTHRSAGP